jgi:transcriptional regulator with XRE-family HTH domain
VLRTLREEHGMTGEELSGRIFRSRTKLSKMENARMSPDFPELLKILEILEVTGDRWHEIIRIARDAAERGWWDDYGAAMGARQRMYADIESDARTIREYNQFAIPGVLQTPEFIWFMVQMAETEGPVDFVPERLVQARQRRQQQILRADGPKYDLIIDEVVVRRPTAPPEIMRDQLRHIVDTATSQPWVTVRVLPLVADFTGRLLPKSAFFLFTFPDPDDPAMAVVDTVNTDLVHIDPEEVLRYTQRYEHLQQAALSPTASLSLLSDAADELQHRIESCS